MLDKTEHIQQFLFTYLNNLLTLITNLYHGFEELRAVDLMSAPRFGYTEPAPGASVGEDTVALRG